LEAAPQAPMAAEEGFLVEGATCKRPLVAASLAEGGFLEGARAPPRPLPVQVKVPVLVRACLGAVLHPNNSRPSSHCGALLPRGAAQGAQDYLGV